MKRAGTPPAQPLAKPAWSDVAKCDKVKKPEWDERTGKLDSSFTYTVEGFKAKDPRFSEESVTVTITVLSDGRLRCDEVGCEAPDFGKSNNTRGEYNVHKHVVAYHAPLQVSITADPDGVLKRVKQQSIGTFFKVTDQAGVDAQRAKAHDGRMRSFLARSPEPRASAPAPAPAHGSVDAASALGLLPRRCRTRSQMSLFCSWAAPTTSWRTRHASRPRRTRTIRGLSRARSRTARSWWRPG